MVFGLNKCVATYKSEDMITATIGLHYTLNFEKIGHRFTPKAFFDFFENLTFLKFYFLMIES